MSYRIVSHTIPNDVEHEVKQLLEFGWKLVGPAQVSQTHTGLCLYTQTLQKEVLKQVPKQ